MTGRDGQPFAWAIGLWGLWTLATWWFEGRIGTFNRPDATADRLVYTVVANLLVGVLGGVLLLRRLGTGHAGMAALSGFGSPARTFLWVPVGAGLGLAVYFGQGAPSTDPVVILNAYAQVFVVSMAEVVVCWPLAGATAVLWIGGSKWVSLPPAMVASSLLFGLYHFGHSPPFDTVGMVVFLSLIGLVTSAFFVLSRDVYATVVFHSFLGAFGVVQALAAGGRLETFRAPQVPLIVTAVAALLVLVLADRLLVRTAR